MKQIQDIEIKVVQQILDEAIMNNKPYYLIKWKDLPHQNDTWQSIENLQCIVGMLQKWIRKKRIQKEKFTLESVTSFCDTIYNTSGKRQIKRKKRIKKNSKDQKIKNDFVVLDDQSQEIEDSQPFQKIQQESFIDEQVQNASKELNNLLNYQVLQKNLKNQNQPNIKKQNQQEKIHVEANLQKMNGQKNYQKQKVPIKGMKVVGRVKAEDIEQILSHFKWKQANCFKVLLKNQKKITNMRQQDLKILCPTMLMEYYEMNGINI